jgi:hypothetical protein
MRPRRTKEAQVDAVVLVLALFLIVVALRLR